MCFHLLVAFYIFSTGGSTGLPLVIKSLYFYLEDWKRVIWTSLIAPTVFVFKDSSDEEESVGGPIKKSNTLPDIKQKAIRISPRTSPFEIRRAASPKQVSKKSFEVLNSVWIKGVPSRTQY